MDIIDKPWWMPEVIEWVDGFLATKEDPFVLEFGCGGSTIWLAERALVISIEEESREWFTKINHELQKRKLDGAVFWNELPWVHVYPELLILDGGDRVDHANRHWPTVRSGGVMMLDDSERTSEYARLFRYMACTPRRDFMGVWGSEDPLQEGKPRRTTIWRKAFQSDNRKGYN